LAQANRAGVIKGQRQSATYIQWRIQRQIRPWLPILFGYGFWHPPTKK